MQRRMLRYIERESIHLSHTSWDGQIVDPIELADNEEIVTVDRPTDLPPRFVRIWIMAKEV